MATRTVAVSGNGTVPKVKEIHKPSYTWKKLLNLWTGDPTQALFFPQKEITLEDGTVKELDACYITELEYEDAQGVTEMHKIKLYGQLAEKANERVKEQQCQALVWCEGHVKQESWTDDEGFDHAGHSTIIKPKNFKLLDIKPYESVYIDPSVDPFDAFDAASNTGNSDAPFNRKEIEATQSATGTDDVYCEDAPF